MVLDMKVHVYTLKGEPKEEIKPAKAFSEPIRRDLIKKAFLAEQYRKRQSYGTDILAGKRTSAHYHGRRGIKHSMMNRELSRMKRIHGSGFLHLTARFVPQAVKGRKAHPPKSEKIWHIKINKNEKRKALLSAIAATVNKNIVASRGHVVENVKDLPIVFEDKIQELSNIKEFLAVMDAVGLRDELKRAKKKKIRSGKGTGRGRKYKKKCGPLLVIKEDKGITKAIRNIPGVEIVNVKELSVGVFAPGAEPGRLTLWAKSAVQSLDNIGERDEKEQKVG